MNEKNLVKNIFFVKNKNQVKKIIIYEKNGNKNFGQKNDKSENLCMNSLGFYLYTKYKQPRRLFVHKV